jgi:hypothetical protein
MERQSVEINFDISILSSETKTPAALLERPGRPKFNKNIPIGCNVEPGHKNKIFRTVRFTNDVRGVLAPLAEPAGVVAFVLKLRAPCC